MRALIIVICAVLGSAGCKSTPEDQARLWDTGMASARKWKTRYPNLAHAIDQRVSEARTTFEAAGAEADKAAKLEGMKRANEQLAAIVSPLDRYDRSVREIGRLTKDRALKSASASDVSRAVRKANKAISEGRAILRQTSPSDPDDAIRILENVATRVKTAESNLRRLRDSARRSQKTERKRPQTTGP